MESHEEVHQSEDVLPIRAVLYALGGTLLAGATLAALAGLLLVLWRGAIHPSGRFPDQALGPPHTVAGVRQGVFSLLHTGAERAAAQKKTLSSWSVVDQKAGLVRMPIDVAIDLELGEAAHRRPTPGEEGSR